MTQICKRLATLLCFGACLLAHASAQAACSGHLGKVVINEYNYIENYIEIKVLDSTLTAGGANPFAGWKLAVWKKQGGNMVLGQEENVSSNYTDVAKNTCTTGGSSNYTYVKIPITGSNMTNDTIVVLWDSTGGNKVIDLFRLGQSALQTYPASINSGYSQYQQCTTIENALPSSAYDAPLVGSSANKDIARLPDGTGPWTISLGTGNNSQESLCTTNTSLFSITKTPSSASVGVGSGSTFTWSIVVTNGGDSGNLTNVTVTDTLPANMYLSSCPTSATCTGSAGAYTYFTRNVGTLTPTTSVTITATAYVTAAGTYANTVKASATELAPGYTEGTGSVTAVSSANAANFNCLDSSIGSLSNYSGGSARLYTKITGTAFSLDVAALKSDGTLETGFVGSGGSQKNVTLELVDNTQGTACPTGSCSATCGSSVLSKTLRFPADDITGRSKIDNATGATVSLSSSTAYRNLVCRVTDANQAPSMIRCSSDAFAIRPQQLTLSASGLGTSPYVAGNDFTLTASSGVNGYNTGPQFNTTLLGAANTTGVATGAQSALGSGMLTLSDAGNTAVTSATTFANASGTPASTALGLRYHDVGYLYFNAGSVYDGSFVASSVDTFGTDCVANSGSNTLSGNLYGCQIWNTALNDIGRFKPSAFTVSGSFTPSCAGSFTYMDQSGLGVSMTVAAKSVQAITSTRYGNANCPTAGSCTLVLTAWNGASQVDITRLTPLASFPTSTAAVGSGTTSSYQPAQATTWTSGAYGVSGAAFNFAKNTAAVDGPLSLSLKAAVTDPDSVAIAGSDTIGPTAVRYGRLWLGNCYGSTTQSCTMNYETQYWNGLAFVRNTNDTCTALALPAASLSNWQGGITSVNTPLGNLTLGTFGTGAGTLVLAPPSPTPSSAGAVDVLLTLDASMPWLRSYSGGSYQNPRARATFGIYGSSAKKGPIYLREGN